MKPSLSIVIPALNEETRLRATAEMLTAILGRFFSDYELLIIDDGSRDQTGTIADEFAQADPKIRVVHHSANMGLGYSYREGIRLATKTYVWWIPGDGGGLTSEIDLANILGAVGKADLVLVYLLSENRDWHRRFLSNLHGHSQSAIWAQNKILQRSQCLPAGAARGTAHDLNGHGLLAEISLQLIKGGHGFVEVGMHNRERAGGNSKALRLKNVARVGKVLLRLFWTIRVKGSHKRWPAPEKPAINVGRPLV